MVGHNVPEDRRARITVKPFFDLCGDILGETVEEEGKNTEYYDAIVSRAGACLGDVPEKEKYDVILLDEGQDFSPAMFRVVLSLRRPERDDVMIAMDAEQDLYGRFSLKDLGIDFRGRTHMLPSSYRSTQQIFEFAHRLSGKELPPAVDQETGQMMVFPQYVGRTGLAPVVETFPDPDRLVNHLMTEVRHHIQAEKIPPAEIGILYLSKRRGAEPAAGAASPGGKRTLQSFEQLRGVLKPEVEEKSPPDRIASSLKGAGIPVNWFTENSAAKQSFDLHEPTVKIGTIHSAKGLDFEVVYLIDATGNPVGPPSKSAPADDAARKYRNLLFVGCTRAREKLVILTHQGSGNI
jgi:superfamily I DNA/RNA helicase